jgi:hypothetical protein
VTPALTKQNIPMMNARTCMIAMGSSSRLVPQKKPAITGSGVFLVKSPVPLENGVGEPSSGWALYLMLVTLMCCGLSLPDAVAQGVQGAVYFYNHAPATYPPVDAPVFSIDGVTPLAGTAYMAQLYAGPAGSFESSLTPVGEPVPFRTGRAAGYWEPRFVKVPFVFAGQTATLQARVWEATAGSFEAAQSGAGLYGSSKLLQIQLGGLDIGLAAYLWGLESFSLVPEPGSISLALFGFVVLLLAHRRSLKAAPPNRAYL